MTRVLIVDDEPDILLMLRVTLESHGFETGLAADGDEALKRMRQEAFDVVLLDVMMPVLDGWSVLEALHGDPAAPPVVVLSAKTSVHDQDRAARLGAAAYVTKPFDIDIVVEQLHRAVGTEPDEADR